MMNLNYYKNFILQVILIIFGLLLNQKPSLGKPLQNWRMQLPVKTEDSPVARRQQTLDRLLQLMQQRLLLQHHVARWKWNHQSPIEAPQREQELLKKLRQQAIAYGLDPDTVSTFFQWQIQAGKLLQIADFQTWQRQGIQSFEHVPDLNQVVRPSLDKLDTELLSTLANLAPVAHPMIQHQQLIQSRAQIVLRGDGIDNTVRRVVLAPLLEAVDKRETVSLLA